MPSKSVLSRSPLHAWQEARGARFGERHGWRLVESFAGPRAGLLLADVTPFAKVAFTGGEVPRLAEALLADAQPGKVEVISGAKPGWLCYLSEEQLIFLSTRLDADVPEAFQFPGQPEQVKPAQWDVTSGYAGFLLLGTDAPRILGSQLNLGGGSSVLSPGTCVETGFFGVSCLLARAPDERPVVGIWVGWDVAEYVWEQLWRVGAAQGVTAAGAEVLHEFGWHA
jgi:glycine cleavage system aminomethyltransferase T